MTFSRRTLTFPVPCRCSGGSVRLHGGNQTHCTPSRLSGRLKIKTLWLDNFIGWVNIFAEISQKMPYVPDTGAVFTRFSPHSNAYVAGLQTTSLSAKNVERKCLFTCLSFVCTQYWIYLDWWCVGDLYNLFPINEKVRAFCRNVPRPWSWLGKGIYWLAFFQIKQHFQSSITLKINQTHGKII